ncbi:MAG: histidine kinase [Desulfobacteraceae bacterium]|nr:histidine kinase [Desulfobacteraceae bacterium]
MKKTQNIFMLAVAVMALIGLYLSSIYSFLLFHTLAEMFSISIACGMFMIAWNSRQFTSDHYLLFLGIAYLFVAGLDLLHTIAYKGMHLLIIGDSTNVAAQFWIAARCLESVSLLISPLFLRRKLQVDLLLSIFGIIFFLIILSIVYWKIFPACFIEGSGLTPFKIRIEYVICGILLVAATVIYKRRAEQERVVVQWLLVSIAFTIASEIAFTDYVWAYGFANLIGHYFKILSFYFIYRAIIQTALTNPYSLLFLELKRSEQALEIARRNLEEKVFERTADLRATVNELSQEVRRRLNAENMLRRLSRKSIDTLENDRKSVAKELHDSIGGSLAAIKFLLEEILTHAGKNVDLEVKQIRKAIYYMADTIRETKRISARLRPLTLEELGLLSTIEAHVRRFSDLYSGIKIERRIEVKEEEIPDNLKIVIYRILQEALNNVGKHSKASSVCIGLKAVNGKIIFELADNGLGFDPEIQRQSNTGLSGYGLQSMRERTEIVGGCFTVISGPHQGVHIKIELPLDPNPIEITADPLPQD